MATCAAGAEHSRAGSAPLPRTRDAKAVDATRFMRPRKGSYGSGLIAPLFVVGSALLASWIPAQRATRVDPGDAIAHHELGYMFKDDGRRRDAIAEFRRYLELRPDAGDSSSVRDDIYYLQEEQSRRIP